MKTSTKTAAGIALAIAAASMMSITPAVAASSDSAMVKCFGVNVCKGHNDCKTANNACKGHGSCKGQGFVKMSAGACSKIGGEAK